MVFVACDGRPPRARRKRATGLRADRGCHAVHAPTRTRANRHGHILAPPPLALACACDGGGRARLVSAHRPPLHREPTANQQTDNTRSQSHLQTRTSTATQGRHANDLLSFSPLRPASARSLPASLALPVRTAHAAPPPSLLPFLPLRAAASGCHGHHTRYATQAHTKRNEKGRGQCSPSVCT